MNSVFIPTSLKEYARFRIAREMMDAIRKNSPTSVDTFMPIVTDDQTLVVFSSLFSLKDLPELKISRIEKLSRQRKRLPNSEGIYFLSPSTQSIELAIKDFENNKKPQYGGIHLCMINCTPTEIFQKLAASVIAPKIMTYLDINLDFHIYDHNVFYFTKQNNLRMLNSIKRDLTRDVDPIIDKLFTVCCTLYEMPIIRYYTKSTICKYIATKLSEKLIAFQSATKFSIHQPRGVLFIVERSMDMCSCVMHDFNLMPIIFDMSKKKDLYEVLLDNGESMILDCSNEIWEKNKYLHITEAFSNLQKESVRLTEKTKSLQGNNGQVTAIKGMQEYQNKSQILHKMNSLTTNSAQKFKDRNIGGMIRLEQAIIAGKDDAKGIKSYKAIGLSFSNLQIDLPNITDEEIVRLLIMYAAQYEIPKKDINSIVGFIRAEEWKACFENLKNLGLIHTEEYSKGKRKDDTLIKDDDMNIFEQRVKKCGHHNLIWGIPKITRLLIDASKGKYTEDTAAVTNEKPPSEESRLMVFMVGGLSTTEISYTYNLQQCGILQKHVMLGGTSIVTPTEFLESVSAECKI